MGIYSIDSNNYYYRLFFFSLRPTYTEPKLKEVTNSLKKCAAYWHDIGVQLDFETPELDEIKKDHPNDHKQCLSKLLGRWLKRRDASWMVLVSALEECDDVDKDIVDAIKSKYI